MLLWFLVLHIATLLFWAAALLYLPALLANMHSGRTAITEPPRRHASVARLVFTHLATPAALLAIISGTLVFLFDGTVAVWLIVKLTLVTGLVLCHAATGLLILHAENTAGRAIRAWCWLLAGSLVLLMSGIVWTVLAKPSLEVLPWTLS